MGGYGSGRKHGANCTDEYRSIDIRRWQREGLIELGTTLDWQWLQNGERVASIGVKVETGQLRLNYSYQSNGGDKENLDYLVKLQTSTNHYGGVRYWFTCPAVDCGRRVALLYMAGKIFACRHCYQLAYRSQRETIGQRGHDGANTIRSRLGWQIGIAYPSGYKPKGMHWKTYVRLLSKHNDYANQVMVDMMSSMKKVEQRFTEIKRKMDGGL